MAGIDNSTIFSSGEKLTPTSADDLTIMQSSATDVARINHTGDPEGVVSANPSSLSHDPVSGDLYVKQTGTGNTGWVRIFPGNSIQEINGNSGSITGASVTIEVDTDLGSGFYQGTPRFINSGTISLLRFNDALRNLGIGGNSLSHLTSGSDNIAFGQSALDALTEGVSNAAMGNNTLRNVTTGNYNVAIGGENLKTITTGIRNTALGYEAALGNNNGSFSTFLGYNPGSTPVGDINSCIFLGNGGATADANTMRLGSQGSGNGQVNKAFVAGIVGVTVSNTQNVTIDSTTGQLGVSAVPSLSVVTQVFTSDGIYTPTAGMQTCVIECVGGGGGSGGITAAAVNATGGGGAGGYARKTVSAATIGVSQSVVVGLGGAAGANTGTNGGTGGTSSVGAIVSATGGVGSVGNAAGSANKVIGLGGLGGVGSSGDINSNGMPGNYGTAFLSTGVDYFSFGGAGGNSYFGGGGISFAGIGAVGSAGSTATAYGGGAGGAATSSVVARAGGNGADGVVIITEYVYA